MNLKKELDRLREEEYYLEMDLDITHRQSPKRAELETKLSKVLAQIAEVKSKILKLDQIYVDVFTYNTMFNVQIMNKVSVKLNGRTIQTACQDLIQQVSKDQEIPETRLSWKWFTQLVEVETWKLKKGDRVHCKGKYSRFYPMGNYILDSKSTVPGNWYLKSLDGKKEYCLRDGVNESDLLLITSAKKQVDFDIIAWILKDKIERYKFEIRTLVESQKKDPLEKLEQLQLFVDMLTKSSSFAHKAHKELKKRM